MRRCLTGCVSLGTASWGGCGTPPRGGWKVRERRLTGTLHGAVWAGTRSRPSCRTLLRSQSSGLAFGVSVIHSYYTFTCQSIHPFSSCDERHFTNPFPTPHVCTPRSQAPNDASIGGLPTFNPD